MPHAQMMAHEKTLGELLLVWRELLLPPPPKKKEQQQLKTNKTKLIFKTDEMSIAAETTEHQFF